MTAATIIAIANQKGGVGKTTSAVTIGHGLSLAGLSVLIVDTDPQGHIAIALGQKKANGLHRLLVDDESIHDCCQPARQNLDIIPSDKTTERVNRYLTTADYREAAIQRALHLARYDIIVMDLAPSLNVLHLAALVASDILIVPVKLDHLALDGVNEVLRSMAEINRHGGNIQDFKILPTFFDRATNETRLQFESLVDTYPANVLGPIPQDVRARECASYGRTLYEYAPNTAAVKGYQANGRMAGGYTAAVKSIMEMIYA